MLGGLVALVLCASSGAEVQQRLDALAHADKPIVTHVIVALADNANQGLVPVPAALGNGQDPEHNLYWGARYGVGYFVAHDAGWVAVHAEGALPAHVLRRAVYRKQLARADGTQATAFLVADAYDGRNMREAIADFLQYAAGRAGTTVHVGGLELAAGGAAPLLAFVGHDGLMELPVEPVDALPGAPPRSAAVLACASSPYFGPMLKRAGAHPLLMTTGLMAPEAYSLTALLDATLAGLSASAARDAAAAAYDQYQHCGLRGAKRLFTGAD